jgi:ribosomal protein S18 acetylase RimI-like enzyme
MEIFRLSPNGWQIYKTLRLEALREDSQVFSGSYKESLQRSEDEWKKKVNDSRNHIMFGQVGDDIIGMAAAYQEQGEKVKHIAHIWGVYLKRTYRNSENGKKLLEALLNELTSNNEIEKVNLSVNTTEKTAIELYEKLGFEIIGTLHKELKIGDDYYDEYVMEKFL